MARIRRTKLEVVKQKIADTKQKRQVAENKLASYELELNDLQTQLEKAIAENEKAKEKEKLNEIIGLIRKSPKTLDEVKEILIQQLTNNQE